MFKPLFLLMILMSLAASAYAAPDRYQFDKDHTHILFFVGHEGFSSMIGRIKELDGYFTFDEKEPEKSEVAVTLKPSSIDTDVASLNKVLMGDKFFNIAAYPAISFKSHEVKVTGRNRGDVTGALTLLGVTRPVTLHVVYNRSGIHPFTNNYVSGFSADAVVNRMEFGMTAYPQDVGTDVRIHIEAEGTDPLRHPGNSQAPH